MPSLHRLICLLQGQCGGERGQERGGGGPKDEEGGQHLSVIWLGLAQSFHDTQSTRVASLLFSFPSILTFEDGINT